MVQSANRGHRHEHDDCGHCLFLGQAGPDDVWFCEEENSLILRFGVDGDYHSFPVPIARQVAGGSVRWQFALSLLPETVT